MSASRYSSEGAVGRRSQMRSPTRSPYRSRSSRSSRSVHTAEPVDPYEEMASARNSKTYREYSHRMHPHLFEDSHAASPKRSKRGAFPDTAETTPDKSPQLSAHGEPVGVVEMTPDPTSYAAAPDTVRGDKDSRDLEKGGELNRPGTVPPNVAKAASEKDAQIVAWDGNDDQEEPHTWSFKYRLYITMVTGFFTLCASFCSSAPAFLLPIFMQIWHTNEEVAKAGIFLYVAGFVLGPIIWAPASEIFGRRPTMTIAMFGFTCMNIGCALCPNIGAFIVFRLLAGSFSACPLTISPAILGSVWNLKVLGVGVTVFSIAPMAGPCVGPIMSGYIVQNHQLWRWVFWLFVILGGICTVVSLTVAETSNSMQLTKKAKRLRKETGNERYKSPAEVAASLDKGALFRRTIFDPFKLLALEPMLLAITIYMSFVYGLLYLLFEAFPVVFGMHNLQPGEIGLAFLGYFIGCNVGAALNIFYINPRYVNQMKASGQPRLPPEKRLLSVLIAAPTLTISLFWFAWTSFPSVSLWAPLVASGLFGFSMLLIFVRAVPHAPANAQLGLMTYITEAYLSNAAAAVAGNTILRSSFGVGFPMVCCAHGRTLMAVCKPNVRKAEPALGFLRPGVHRASADANPFYLEEVRAVSALQG